MWHILAISYNHVMVAGMCKNKFRIMNLIYSSLYLYVSLFIHQSARKTFDILAHLSTMHHQYAVLHIYLTISTIQQEV